MMLTPQILRFPSLTSTNSEATRLASEGAAEGLCIVADEQTAGRGRLQRPWISPSGAGIYCSILLRPKIAMAKWPLITLAAALGVVDALAAVCEIEADIKWPNDILVNGRKACGILAETADTPSGRALVVGIGINLTSNGFPRELRSTATSLEEATGHPVEREPVLQALISALDHYYQLLHQGYDTQLISRWCEQSSYANGKSVSVASGDESIVGMTRGLEADGALRVETPKGKIRIIHAGDVTAVRLKENKFETR